MMATASNDPVGDRTLRSAGAHKFEREEVHEKLNSESVTDIDEWWGTNIRWG